MLKCLMKMNPCLSLSLSLMVELEELVQLLTRALAVEEVTPTQILSDPFCSMWAEVRLGQALKLAELRSRSLLAMEVGLSTLKTVTLVLVALASLMVRTVMEAPVTIPLVAMVSLAPADRLSMGLALKDRHLCLKDMGQLQMRRLSLAEALAMVRLLSVRCLRYPAGFPVVLNWTRLLARSALSPATVAARAARSSTELESNLGLIWTGAKVKIAVSDLSVSLLLQVQARSSKIHACFDHRPFALPCEGRKGHVS